MTLLYGFRLSIDKFTLKVPFVISTPKELYLSR